ncbi:MAG: shikimate kinase [Bacteroidia bacterium]|nr:shikimate kinase [Bacteroidia bacterium]
MKRHLALTGFMGSGKTTIGKQIANNSGLPFIDLDEFIEQKEKKTIAEIFEQYGEEKFRKLESFYLNQILSTSGNLVIALGGGTICFHNNLQNVLTHAWLITLMLKAEVLTERLWNEKDKRPLIKNLNSKEELKTFIETKLQERKIFYEKADWILHL